MNTSSSGEIPTISLAGLRSGSREALERIGTEIGAAARGLGFFSVSDHGIPNELIDAAYEQSRAFFALPQDAKDRLSVKNSARYLGYVRIGEENLDPALSGDVKECFNAGGVLYEAQNQWPDLPGFRDTMREFEEAALELVVLLQRAIAIDLGIDAHFFDAHFDAPEGLLRLLRYPPHPGTFDGSSYGAGAHTDYGNLTLLAQDEIGGLEVRRRDGTWIAVPPQPGTFVCNIGDCLMRWTNDIYVSNAHRVVNRAPRERFSIAYFGDPNAESLVTCLPSVLAPGEEAKYPPIRFADYLRQRYDETYTLTTAS